MTLEERVLRVLYEAPTTQDDCDAEARGLLGDLVRAGYASLAAARYTLTQLGSERLADIVEARESSRDVA